MGIEIPAEYGGSEASFTTAIIAIEELAKVDPSISVMADVHVPPQSHPQQPSPLCPSPCPPPTTRPNEQNTLVNTAFKTYGSQALKEKYLPQLATEKLGSFCLSEPASGSDAFALKTRAEKTADGYKLNGSKMWVTNAADAGIFLIFANLDPSKGYKGITCFVAEKEWGVQIAKKEKKVFIPLIRCVSDFLPRDPVFLFYICHFQNTCVPDRPFTQCFLSIHCYFRFIQCYFLFSILTISVARYPRLINLSPPPRRPPHPQRKHPRRRRPRLQNRHRSPERRPHRHRSSNDRSRHGLL